MFVRGASALSSDLSVRLPVFRGTNLNLLPAVRPRVVSKMKPCLATEFYTAHSPATLSSCILPAYHVSTISSCFDRPPDFRKLQSARIVGYSGLLNNHALCDSLLPRGLLCQSHTRYINQLDSNSDFTSQGNRRWRANILLFIAHWF